MQSFKNWQPITPNSVLASNLQKIQKDLEAIDKDLKSIRPVQDKLTQGELVATQEHITMGLERLSRAVAKFTTDSVTV